MQLTQSSLYSFSFFPWDWSMEFGRPDEVVRYPHAVTHHFGLRSWGPAARRAPLTRHPDPDDFLFEPPPSS